MIKKVFVGPMLALGLLVASSAFAGPMMSVLTVQTDDVPAYVRLVGELNRTWKSERIPVVGHVYVPVQAGDQVGVAYFVSFPKNGAEWLMLGDSTTTNAAVASVVRRMDSVRTRVGNSLYTALIDGGVYDDGVVYATFVTPKDTAAYVAALQELDDLMSANGLDDAKLSAYSAIASGEGAGQIQVLISMPAQERMAALMDAMGEDWLQSFLGRLAPMRTLESNGIYATVPTP